jgi:predicted DNA-binding protein with PD1-like motif
MQSFLEPQGKILFLRLEPGEELMEGIRLGCFSAGVKAGTITSCIGSLNKAVYTYVKSDNSSPRGISYLEDISTDKPCELICAQGTVGLAEGENFSVHMHGLMVDVDGKIFGGHLLPGSITCVTVEVSIAVAESGQMLRLMDKKLDFPLFHFIVKD